MNETHRRLRKLAEQLKSSDPSGGNLEGVLAVAVLELLDELEDQEGDWAILNEMREESLAGQRKWGGSDPAAHDASHTFEDWRRYIADHVERARIYPPQDARQHMVKAGGLALSAVRARDAKREKTE